MEEILAQGAEGVSFRQIIYAGKLITEDVVVKHRLPRKYRHPTLDAKIRQKRLLQEARNMLRVRKMGVPVPAILLVDDSEFKLYLQRLAPAFTVRDFLHKVPLPPHEILVGLSMKIGKNIALMHNTNCIHGDLTTSNMMIKPFVSLESEVRGEEIDEFSVLRTGNVGTVYMIDFGLSFVSVNIEDMAVDLYVLERAINSAHPQLTEFVMFTQFVNILEGYKQNAKKAGLILTRLGQVRARGRKKLAFG